MKTSSELFEDIQLLNIDKQNLIKQYLRAQSCDDIPYDQKLANTNILLSTLLKKNYELARLEHELVGAIELESVL